jgi:MmyB-like transcription regulator ligand binding domain
VLRSAAGRDPYDRDLSDLVGELSTQSDEFRTRWAAHNVRFHDTGVKDLHHPVVGDITLTYNRMDLAADPGQMLMIWTAEPGSKSAEALSLLGSWTATPEQPELQEAPDHL